MTTPTEEEARAEAEEAFPESEWTQPATLAAFRDTYAKGYLAGVSRVSTPPNEPGGCSAHGKRDCTEDICDGEWSPETGSFSIRPVTPPSEKRMLMTHPHDGHGPNDTCRKCETPATPPTDEDERGALFKALDGIVEYGIDHRDAVDAVLRAGFRRQAVSTPEPEMVERAREHMSRVHGVNLPAKIIRSTLEAALYHNESEKDA